MATTLFCLALISLFCLSAANAITEELPAMSVSAKEQSSLQTYIVHVSKPKSTFLSAQSEVDVEKWYESFLPVSTVDSNQEQRRMIYSYKSVVSGFAAKLTADEVKAMEKKDGFVLAMPERILSPQTTHTPNFLGLHKEVGLWKNSNFGQGVIIGLLDTGVTPNHPSFSDQGMPPPPAKWKGKCEFNGTVCNNKLIGARAFQGGTTPAPPLDDEGHGTHTASTAGGSFVKDANVLGNANGTASGMAPNAHVAMYKVCSEVGCSESDILAAMEAAIEDGVDVLSLSLGGSSTPFYADSIALGAFAAIQKGIFVSCSAGNSGPAHSTLSNEAPWILTVGASTIDRSIRAAAFLGDKALLDGESLYQPTDFPDTLLPLIYAGANKNGSASSALCGPGSLKGLDVKGKVVLCERGGGIARIAKGQEVKDAGGAAMILMNEKLDGVSTLADAHVLPATHVGNPVGVYIKNYINKTAKPMATIIFRGTVIGGQSAPQVTSFSSRGPSLASPGILKPDIIGPGVSILAAWPFPLANNTNSKSTFNIISGTSMSCPHLSGIAALIKSAHPDWSPAAIKSAIMTSADLMDLQSKPISDETEKPADFFAIGAGHVNPPKASDPGLVYDAQPNDYLPYLCGLNYTDAQVSIILQRPVKCSNVSSIPEAQLNYPSFSITLGPTQTLTRTVTNVGPAKSSYTYKLLLPPGVSAAVSPAQLDFSAINQKLTFAVKFSGKGPINTFAQGSLTWSSAQHTVRSPVSVWFQ